jgi:hypothetical protein
MRAAGTGLSLIARIIMAIAAIVFLIIAIGILLLLLDANPGNAIVQVVTDAARTLAGPFNGLFTLTDERNSTALNWGIAAFVYLFVGGIIAGILRRFGAASAARRAP